MRTAIRVAMVGLGCVGLAVAVVMVLIQPEILGSPGPGRDRRVATASRTAAGEPGIVSTTVLAISPPTARLSMAAGPIS